MSLGSGKWFLVSNSTSTATSEKKKKKKKKISTIKIKMFVLQNEIGMDRP